jgi:putative endonuclease
MLFKKKIEASGKSPLTDEKAVTIGRLGEDAAVNFLHKSGYTVIERNFRAGRNEIDIIAVDKSYIIFVEVKARTYRSEGDMPYGSPAEAVTYSKQQRTLAAVSDYIRLHGTGGRQPRIDVIEVFLSPSPKFASAKKITDINHIVNAFGA